MIKFQTFVGENKISTLLGRCSKVRDNGSLSARREAGSAGERSRAEEEGNAFSFRYSAQSPRYVPPFYSLFTLDTQTITNCHDQLLSIKETLFTVLGR